MQISRWGNSLAVRIPAALVQELGLKEGDDVEMELADHCSFKVQRRMTRDEALEVLRKSRCAMPANFKFNREEAHERPELNWKERK